MVKDEVKLLAETDDRLCWWAGAVLFAEICDLIHHAPYERGQGDYGAEYSVVTAKVRQFEQLVVQRQLEQAKDRAERKPSLEERVRMLEKQVYGKSLDEQK